MLTDRLCTVSSEEIRRIGRCASVHGAPYVEQLWILYEYASDEEIRQRTFEALIRLPEGHPTPS